jgi:hypothetical protein
MKFQYQFFYKKKNKHKKNITSKNKSIFITFYKKTLFNMGLYYGLKKTKLKKLTKKKFLNFSVEQAI